jgi:hypothetical protein
MALIFEGTIYHLALEGGGGGTFVSAQKYLPKKSYKWSKKFLIEVTPFLRSYILTVGASTTYSTTRKEHLCDAYSTCKEAYMER